MAKKTIKKYYKRRGRWSSNIKNINEDYSIPSTSTFFKSVTLCQNPPQSEATVSQVFTLKNVEFSYKLEKTNDTGNEDLENIQAYIMFVPQGYIITETLPFNHPEWIMAYKYIGNPYPDSASTPPPSKIRTRLARKLNTGDGIIFLLIGENEGVAKTGRINGLVRWWTKSN